MDPSPAPVMITAPISGFWPVCSAIWHNSRASSRLISAYFTKSPEFTDPTDPLNGTTGNTIFTINERFTSIESIQRHVENASQNDYFPEFYEIMGNYGKVIGIGGEVLHSIR